ncbi:DNA-protecting protein DprA [Salinimicrobium tongyeongense]|uniref:DNA-protecting protein DprA n=1 Tax=Salinimicrobium tongyeongense TaxID=2809707 RepID=A0ABY6NUJ7_9FLAO|nr:DNA-processing protein DprA [Salinimicrobium tongyeongense]UZH56592.1 DNA-protecting protein DprA [Salinimicrobium tongyeongense]
MKVSDLQYVLALQHVPNLGDVSAKKLIRHTGSAEAVFKEKKSVLLKIGGIGNTKLSYLFSSENLKAAEKELEFILKNSIKTLYYEHSDYPEKLKHCTDGPILLFQRGNIQLINRKIISVVGTRKATPHGINFCEQLLEELAPLDPVIVSGFAYGIDIAAQRAALKHKLQTIGCLAHGLNQMYPGLHQKYVAEVERNGGFLTDFWSTDTFDRNNFLKRNRIIAGMCEATIVIESAEKGGSLVTADIANSYNREVFAVPGRPGDLQSKGCNMLIKSQQAHVLTSAVDLVYMLNWRSQTPVKPVQKQLFVELEEEEQALYGYLKDKGKEQLDLIALNCSIPTFKAATLLLNMELKGVVRPLPGKLFEAV